MTWGWVKPDSWSSVLVASCHDLKSKDRWSCAVSPLHGNKQIVIDQRNSLSICYYTWQKIGSDLWEARYESPPQSNPVETWRTLEQWWWWSRAGDLTPALWTPGWDSAEPWRQYVCLTLRLAHCTFRLACFSAFCPCSGHLWRIFCLDLGHPSVPHVAYVKHRPEKLWTCLSSQHLPLTLGWYDHGQLYSVRKMRPRCADTVELSNLQRRETHSR